MDYNLKAWAGETTLGRHIFNYNFRMFGREVPGWQMLKAVTMHKDRTLSEITYLWQNKDAAEQQLVRGHSPGRRPSRSSPFAPEPCRPREKVITAVQQPFKIVAKQNHSRLSNFQRRCASGLDAEGYEGYSTLLGNNEGKSPFARERFYGTVTLPNHALYQSKLHPASGDAYHEQSLCASRNFFAGSLDVSNALRRAFDNSLLAKCPFRQNVAFLDLSGPVGCFCPAPYV